MDQSQDVGLKIIGAVGGAWTSCEASTHGKQSNATHTTTRPDQHPGLTPLLVENIAPTIVSQQLTDSVKAIGSSGIFQGIHSNAFVRYFPAKRLREQALSLDPALTSLEQLEPRFSREVATLVRAARKLKAAGLKQAMHISDDLATLNAERFKTFALPSAGEG